MKKRILAILLILVMVLSLTACNKQKDPTEEENGSGTGTNQTTNQGEIVQGTGINMDTKSDDSYQNTPNEEFAAFVKKQYIDSIEKSYLTTHIYYTDPEAAGLNMDNIDISFGLAPTDESYAEDRAYYQEILKTFEGFDRSTLSRAQQDEYDCLEWEIKSVMAMTDEKFDYYQQLFAPPNSLDQEIVSWLSTWELRSEREAEELVTLINSIPSYVDSAIAYAKKQQEKELFMSDFDTVIEGCDDVIELGMNSSVLSGLIKKMEEIEGLDDSKKETLKAAINEAFEKSYLPSFTAIKDAMNEMRNGYNNPGGLSAFPNGKEYFEVNMNYVMGTFGVSADDAESFLKEREDAYMNQFMTLYTKHPEEVNLLFEDGPETGYTDYKTILENNKVKMLTDNAEVKDLAYNIENADPEEKLTEKNVAAYFIIPPLDGDHLQQMRVDPNNENVGSIETYATVSHEGFPGHMYQYAYVYASDASDYMKTIGVNSMVEGSAVYAQYNSLDYLEGLPNAYCKAYALNEKISYIIYGLMDIGINYSGWSFEEAMDVFSNEGFSVDEETGREIYDFLRFTPFTYEPYGYGYELVALLREKAEKELGKKFDAKSFNQALLDAYFAPYSIVTRHINEYILEASA